MSAWRSPSPVIVADILARTTISAVWTALGGDEPRQGRARAYYRGGNNRHAVSLDDAKMAWYDRRDGKGGGVLDLIQYVRGCSRADALQWLSTFTGLPLDDRRPTAAEKREYARRIARSDQLAQEVADFANGLDMFLENFQRKMAPAAEWLLGHGIDAGSTLGVSAGLALLHRADADLLVQAYLNISESDRRPFREAGRKHREQAHAITRATVDLLAQKKEDVT